MILILTSILFLSVGIILSIVIERIPIILKKNWQKEYTEAINFPQKAFKLHSLHIVELITLILSSIVIFHFGWHIETLFALIFTWILICLSFIDIEHQLLPDHLTLSLLWLGLIISLKSIFIDPHAAILGASFGYMSLWTLNRIFKYVTQKESMGYGDFKLLAALGAWLGWALLPYILLIASLLGTLISLILVVLKKCDHDTPIPFGPYLAIAGWIMMLSHTEMINILQNHGFLL